MIHSLKRIRFSKLTKNKFKDKIYKDTELFNLILMKQKMPKEEKMQKIQNKKREVKVNYKKSFNLQYQLRELMASEEFVPQLHLHRKKLQKRKKLESQSKKIMKQNKMKIMKKEKEDKKKKEKIMIETEKAKNKSQ